MNISSYFIKIPRLLVLVIPYIFDISASESTGVEVATLVLQRSPLYYYMLLGWATVSSECSRHVLSTSLGAAVVSSPSVSTTSAPTLAPVPAVQLPPLIYQLVKYPKQNSLLVLVMNFGIEFLLLLVLVLVIVFIIILVIVLVIVYKTLESLTKCF